MFLKESMITPCWATSLDIRDAYLLIPIRHCLHRYPAFQINHPLYFFQVVHFGLFPGPLVFTKVATYPLAFLRKQNIQTLNYHYLGRQQRDRAERLLTNSQSVDRSKVSLKLKEMVHNSFPESSSAGNSLESTPREMVADSKGRDVPERLGDC